MTYQEEVARTKGGFDALLAFKNVLENHSDMLIHLKFCSKKSLNSIKMILSACLENTDGFMRLGDNVELYYDTNKKQFKIVEQQ